MASIDERICDSGSEYGDAEDFTPNISDKQRKGSPLSDKPIKKINSLPDILQISRQR